MSIFSHVTIVTSGALLVPYGLTVWNGCSVIAASAVVALCTALLTGELGCFIFTLFFLESFSILVEVILAFLANPQNFSAWENDGINLTGDLKSRSCLFSFLFQFCLYN